MKSHNLLLIAFFILFSCKEKTPKKVVLPKIKIKAPTLLCGLDIDNYKVINDTIKKDENFGLILDRHHVDYSKINQIATTVKDTFDVRRIRIGKPYVILAEKDSLKTAKYFIYKHNKVKSTIINFKDSIVKAYAYKEPVTIRSRKVSGEILTNFSNALDTIGVGASMASRVADIYAWTVDFYRLQKNDKFKIIFEERYIKDSILVGYGDVKSAVFKHAGKDLYAYRYVADSIRNIPEYYDDEAGLLRRQFLKSPIKFQYRISSRYNLRRKIALYGRVKPHKGTDFAAPKGTPIMATASGTVTKSTRSRGNGNYVKIRHNSTYSTQYLHMRRRKVKVGEFVQQGDIIGWVGTTGNSSGPHVCYRFWKSGRQVDPFKQKLPSAKPMDKKHKPAYFEYIKSLKQELSKVPFVNQVNVEQSNKEVL